MTGYSMTSILEKAKNLGAVEILNKPLDLAQVIKTAEKIKEDVVVIVDDDEDFTQSMQEVLETKNIKVLIARTSLELIESIKTHKAKVIILDLKLQKEEGFDIFLKLQKLQSPESFIIVTGYVDEESDNINKLKELSVGQILEKPVDPQELLKLVNRISA